LAQTPEEIWLNPSYISIHYVRDAHSYDLKAEARGDPCLHPALREADRQARADLAHITAAIRIFEASGDPKEMSRYVDTYRMFKRGEPIDLCKELLASGPKSTCEMALYLMAAKGLDTGDKVLAKALAAQLIHCLRMQAQRGRIVRDILYPGFTHKRYCRLWRLHPVPKIANSV